MCLYDSYCKFHKCEVCTELNVSYWYTDFVAVQCYYCCTVRASAIKLFSLCSLCVRTSIKDTVLASKEKCPVNKSHFSDMRQVIEDLNLNMEFSFFGFNKSLTNVISQYDHYSDIYTNDTDN